jgi:Family of unknown function (DUF6807)
MTAVPGDASRPLRVAAGGGGWTYVWDHRRKPHLHPVATPAGLVLTRVEPPDHPWQRGVWFVVKFVDGDNFWEEWGSDGWGVQRHEHRPQLADGVVDGELVWLRPDRSTVAIRERRRLRHVELGDDAYAVDWDVTLRAPRDAVLDRSPHNGQWGGYSGLAFRGREDWRDTRLLLDDGESRDRVAPHRSRWCDLSGPGGGAVAGGVSRSSGQPVAPRAVLRHVSFGRRLRRGLGQHPVSGVPVGRAAPPGGRPAPAAPLPDGRPRRRVGRRAVRCGVGGVCRDRVSWDRGPRTPAALRVDFADDPAQAAVG